MGEWTKGPWKADYNLGCKSIKGGKKGSHKQAQYVEIACTVGLSNEGEDEANAQLMATSPMMYAELEQIADELKSFSDGGVHKEWADENIDSINTVLAKARGDT